MEKFQGSETVAAPKYFDSKGKPIHLDPLCDNKASIGSIIAEATLAVHEMRLAAKFISAMLPPEQGEVVTDALRDISDRLESAVNRIDRSLGRSR